MKTHANAHSHTRACTMAALLLAAASTPFLAGCASTPPPPTAQVAVSDAAVTRAVNAGGNEWAPAEMRSARDKLDQAKQAMADRNYEKALSLATEAQVDARLAESKADASKAKKASDALQESNRVLRDELSRKPK
jgi:predicted S18 family serine protease